jgi:hypothetical protein
MTKKGRFGVLFFELREVTQRQMSRKKTAVSNRHSFVFSFDLTCRCATG